MICSENIIRNNYRSLTELLIRKKLTVTSMESATSGQIASLITDTEGASAVLKGAFITYSNEAKIMMGVPAETIEKYSVYSSETSAAMAKACAAKLRSDIGIGITGTMGNTDPVNPDNSVPGQVYFSLYFRNEMHNYFIEITPQPSRLMYKLTAAEKVYEELVKLIG